MSLPLLAKVFSFSDFNSDIFEKINNSGELEIENKVDKVVATKMSVNMNKY